MILVDKLEQSATLHLSTNVFHGPALPIAKYLFPIAKMLPSCLQLSYQAIFGSFHPKSSQKKQKVKTVQTKFEMLPNGHFNIILSQKRGEICEGENPPPPFVECFMNVFGGRTCKIGFGGGEGGRGLVGVVSVEEKRGDWGKQFLCVGLHIPNVLQTPCHIVR